MGLCGMLTGMVSGYLQEAMGYELLCVCDGCYHSFVLSLLVCAFPSYRCCARTGCAACSDVCRSLVARSTGLWAATFDGGCLFLSGFTLRYSSRRALREREPSRFLMTLRKVLIGEMHVSTLDYRCAVCFGARHQWHQRSQSPLRIARECWYQLNRVK